MSKNSKLTTTFLVIMFAVVIIAGTVLLLGNSKGNNVSGTSVVNGNEQILEIKAVSGGYSPNKLSAKAGIPGKIIFPAVQSFGCQNSVVIPDLDASKVLSRNSDTEFAFQAQPVGKTIKGSCAMGMYDFEINFN